MDLIAELWIGLEDAAEELASRVAAAAVDHAQHAGADTQPEGHVFDGQAFVALEAAQHAHEAAEARFVGRFSTDHGVSLWCGPDA